MSAPAAAESALATTARRYWSDKSDGMHRGSDEASYAKYAAELLAMLPAGGTLIDVGCGACQVTTYLAPHFSLVIGFDQSESMLAAARARIERLGLRNIDVRFGNAVAFPASLPKAGVVLSYGVVQYLSSGELLRHLSECRRVVADNGIACSAIVPDVALRDVYYYRTLVPTDSRVVSRLSGCAELARRRLRGRLARNPLWDGMGNWFSTAEFARVAGAAGFDAEFRHCWYYEYRFHALLRPCQRTLAPSDCE
jgi:SAM-dependent methyltransferase